MAAVITEDAADDRQQRRQPNMHHRMADLEDRTDHNNSDISFKVSAASVRTARYKVKVSYAVTA